MLLMIKCIQKRQLIVLKIYETKNPKKKVCEKELTLKNTNQFLTEMLVMLLIVKYFQWGLQMLLMMMTMMMMMMMIVIILSVNDELYPEGTLIPRSSTQGRGIKISPQSKCYKSLCYFLQNYKLEILMRILWTRLDKLFTVLDKTNFKENMQ